MKNLLQKRLFYLSILFVLVTNVFIFIHIYNNRADEPTSHTYLSLRELYHSDHKNWENSGISLRILFRSPPYAGATWLDEKKLREIGFSSNELYKSEKRGQNIKKELFIVLEQNANKYQESLQKFHNEVLQAKALYEDKKDRQSKNKYEDAEHSYNNEKTRPSRLFAIDAGQTYEQLRHKYSDTNRYIIVKGIIQVIDENKMTRRGIIRELSRSNIYLPKKLHKDFLQKYNHKQDENEEFIEVKYGTLYEPWISGMRL
ncbi:MAG: DUF4824 family protein [Sulfurimonadaceae bacterium]|jgi:hypothetical protein|nr:DUF4824 family protein [Sulfurimonadaceae bacterium]